MIIRGKAYLSNLAEHVYRTRAPEIEFTCTAIIRAPDREIVEAIVDTVKRNGSLPCTIEIPDVEWKQRALEAEAKLAELESVLKGGKKR